MLAREKLFQNGEKLVNVCVGSGDDVSSDHLAKTGSSSAACLNSSLYSANVAANHKMDSKKFTRLLEFST